MKLIITVLALTLPLSVLAGEDRDDHYKPKPPTPVVQPAAPQGDSVHHESRSSKLAKIVGVAALVGLTYHLAWGGTPDQNKGKITFQPRKE